MLKNSKSVGLKVSNNSDGQKGFTILELLVSMIIFMIVTGAAYGVLLIAKRSRTTVNQKTQMTKNARIALNLIGRDTLNAGFGYPLRFSVTLPDDRMATLLTLPKDVDTNSDSIPPIIAGNNAILNTFAIPNTNTDQITFLFKDSTFNIAGSAGPPDTQTSQSFKINSLALKGGVNEASIDPSSGNNTACDLNDVFIITGATGSALGVLTAKVNTNKLQFAANDVLNFNQNGSASPLALLAPKITMQRVNLVSYFVAADGTLTRREYGNSTTVTKAQPYVDNPLVYNVEDFQIRYILDNGAISDDPSAGANGTPGDGDDDQSIMNSVRQIRFTVTIRSSESNDAGQPARETMTATYSTRNLGYFVN